VKPPSLREGSAGHAPNVYYVPWRFPYNVGKITEKLQSGNPKGVSLISAENNSFSRFGHPAVTSTCLPTPAALGFRVRRRGSTLSQRRYLPSCPDKGFPTSSNIESKLAVRALMWSANSVTSRSSCICLILTYQGHPQQGEHI
jgi:hypothetical protein